MRKHAVLFLLFVALICAAPAAAQKKPYSFDKAHSEINFVGEALLLSANGFFGTFDGDVQIDAKDWEASSISLTIDAASINTRNERRDNHLRSADFFDASNHPKITFVATKITKVDDQNIRIAGDMTIRGVTKSMEIPVRVVFFRPERVRIRGQFQINRKEFNINYNSRMNPIEDMVSVSFDLNLVDPEAMRQQRPPAKQQP